jgi:large subunit ribosomal protein L29
MKTKELRELTTEELIAHGNDLQEEAVNLSLQKATGQLENPARVRLVRRERARVKSLLNERHRVSA